MLLAVWAAIYVFLYNNIRFFSLLLAKIKGVFLMNNNQNRVFIEGAMMIAVAQILSLLPTRIGSSFTVSIGSIPIILFALRYGWQKGLIVGLAYGLFKIAIGDVYWLHFAQGLIEYTIPYTCLGLAGIFSKPLKQQMAVIDSNRPLHFIVSASFLAIFVRFFWHFLAGVLYWGEFAPEGWSPFVFSAVFNGASAFATAGVVILVLVFLYKRSKQIFQVN